MGDTPDTVFAGASLGRVRFFWALAGLVVLGSGLAVRYAMPVDPFTRKYAGSMLWAALVFICCRGLFPSERLWKPVVASLMIAAAVEFSRLLSYPPLDAFRLTLAGQLLLGRIFSPWNLLAYGLAIMTSAFITRWIEGRQTGQTAPSLPLPR